MKKIIVLFFCLALVAVQANAQYHRHHENYRRDRGSCRPQIIPVVPIGYYWNYDYGCLQLLPFGYVWDYQYLRLIYSPGYYQNTGYGRNGYYQNAGYGTNGQYAWRPRRDDYRYQNHGNHHGIYSRKQYGQQYGQYGGSQY